MKNLYVATIVIVLLGLLTFGLFSFLSDRSTVRIGSKAFTESYILGEILTQKIESEFPEIVTDRRLGMGGTGLVFEAVRSGNLAAYIEYTGTITEAILQRPDLLDLPAIRTELETMGITISEPLGFNNTYAFAMRESHAAELGISKISDLAAHPQLRIGVTYEFLNRSDGYPAVAETYGLTNTNIRGMEHALAYDALESGSIDLMDVYTTDAKLSALDLRLLEDDQSFFPRYDAVILANLEFTKAYPEIWEAFRDFEGAFSEERMTELNALVDLDRRSIAEAARFYFDPNMEFSDFDSRRTFGVFSRPILVQELWVRTKEHAMLVFIAALISILIGVPLGFLANYSTFFSRVILSSTGVMQTLPSLALLGFLMPFFGIGLVTSLIAIILYSLLPIVRNTYLGVASIDNSLNETSDVIGMSSMQRLFWVELPLSMPSILAGIKTSAVTSVGTATLAAFIGAGGYGAFILQGIATLDSWVIIHGAIPAAVFALLVQGFFDLSERVFVPKGLRLSTSSSTS